MTTKYAILRKRCLNYTAYLTVIRREFPFGNMVKIPSVKKIAAGKRLNAFLVFLQKNRKIRVYNVFSPCLGQRYSVINTNKPFGKEELRERLIFKTFNNQESDFQSSFPKSFSVPRPSSQSQADCIHQNMRDFVEIVRPSRSEVQRGRWRRFGGQSLGGVIVALDAPQAAVFDDRWQRLIQWVDVVIQAEVVWMEPVGEGAVVSSHRSIPRRGQFYKKNVSLVFHLFILHAIKNYQQIVR